MERVTCTKCGKKLNPAAIVWLELKNGGNVYRMPGEVPAENSQGVFPFGSDCAREELAHAAQSAPEPGPVVRVLNLSSGEEQVYTCSPRNAVIAAYAQSRGDCNTWDYEARYGREVLEGEVTFMCGDFSAFKTGVLTARKATVAR